MEKHIKVPAIVRADQIFNFLYEKEYATQTEISTALRIPKASTNRILAELLQLKYINLNDHYYSLGEKFYFFSTKKEKYSLLKNISLPYLENLSLEFKETFKLSVLDSNKIRTIAKIESSDIVKIPVDENAIFPLHAGAASKLLICQLSNNELDTLLDETLPKYTENTIINREKLKDELIIINSKKRAFDNGEHSKNIKAVAVPILDKHNRIVAAMSCPCFSNSWDNERALKIMKKMEIICEKIRKRLTYFE